MCEPLTILAITGAVAAGTGTVLGAEGQYQSDKDNQEILEGQERSTLIQADADAAALNAKAKEDDFRADQARKRGRLILNRNRRESQAELGEIKTSLAVRGVKITTGSAQRIISDQNRASAMDEIILQQNTSLVVWGFETRAKRFREGANLAIFRGRTQAELFSEQAAAIGRAARIRRVSTLLSGFGRIALLSASAFRGGGGGPTPDTLPAKG